MPSKLELVLNDDLVPPGLVEKALRERGLAAATVAAYRGDAIVTSLPDACIVMGGTMGVDEIQAFPFLTGVKQRIRQMVDHRIPLLGICLGGQMLAEVSGGRVLRNRRGEKGCCRVTLTEEGEQDPLFAGLPPAFVSFQWHNDAFDLPPGATGLASSPACRHQAFVLNETAYGLQFHPEVTLSIVTAWASRSPEPAVAESICNDFKRRCREYTEQSMCLLTNFLDICGL
jgi:GMP synthase (glutamine-hydrolysing)